MLVLSVGWRIVQLSACWLDYSQPFIGSAGCHDVLPKEKQISP